MSLTTEQLRALCIKHGVHPNAEGKMPRNAWAAINELNDMLPADGIWPIARLSIGDDGQCAGATLYAPGLPVGEHDVYPAAVVAHAPAPAVEPPKLLCGRCGVDRYKAPCGDTRPGCPVYGIGAQKGGAL